VVVKLVLVILLVTLGGWLLMQYTGRGRPPEAGKAAPDFSLPDAAGRMHRLADYRGRWLVLYFYPKADTPGCTRESCALRDEWVEFQRRGVAILGVSLDEAAAQKSFADRHGLPFPLLSDLTGRVAMAYGSVWDLAVVRFAKRHTFLIDPDGRIAKAYFKVSPERHGKELIADLETFGVEARETRTIMSK
jgi:peroxiredoxin Q/BCP